MIFLPLFRVVAIYSFSFTCPKPTNTYLIGKLLTLRLVSLDMSLSVQLTRKVQLP